MEEIINEEGRINEVRLGQMPDTIERGQFETLKDVLDELKHYVPETIDCILWLDEVLLGYTIDTFRENTAEIMTALITDLDEFIEEIERLFKVEFLILNGEMQTHVKSTFESYIQFINHELLLFYFLKPVFKKFGISTTKNAEDVSDEGEQLITSTNIYKYYEVPNMNISRKKLESIYKALGLIEIKEKGKGSHTGWYDLIFKELTIPMSSTGRGRIWVKNKIKDLLERGASFHRVKSACVKCHIPFPENKKSI